MIPEQKLGVWLTHDAACEFLYAQQPESRWAVLGEFVRDEPGVGTWIRIDHIEQTKETSEIIHWRVKPPVCLIRWDGVITVQEADRYEDVKVTGFSNGKTGKR
jgi:hypothetical protein